MKGKNKRKKGQFTMGNVPKNKGNTLDSNSKLNKVKRTYIRLTRSTHQKVVNIPRSVRYHMLNDGRQKSSDAAVLLRPKQESSILDSGMGKIKNDIRYIINL